MRITMGLAAILLIGLNGCMFGPALVGSGVAKRETREVGDFTGIVVESSIAATLTIGPKASVVVSGDDNIVPLIMTEVRDGQLIARVVGPSFRTSTPLKLTIVVPKLDSVFLKDAASLDATLARSETLVVRISDAASAALNGVDSELVQITCGDAVRLKVVGRSNRLKLTAKDASNVDADELSAETVNATTSDTANASVLATGTINAKASDASNLTIEGNPKTRLVYATDVARIR